MSIIKGVDYSHLKKNVEVVKYQFKKKDYNPLYFIIEELLALGVSEFYVYGGKSSAKTFSIAQLIANYCNLNSLSSICFRKQSTIIKTTIKQTFKVAIKKIYKNESPYKSFDFSFRGISNNEIVFKGLDDESKAKGVEDFSFIFFDELNQFDYEEYFESLNSFRGENAIAFFGTWNPISDKSWVKTKVIDVNDWYDYEGAKLPSLYSFVKLSADKTKALIKTDYRDNYWTVGSPCGTYGFVDQKLIDRYESAKITDPYWYNINVLGNWGHINIDDPFITAITPENYGHTELDEYHPIWLSFDFNKMATCIVSQHYKYEHLIRHPDHLGFPLKDRGGFRVIAEHKFDSVGEKFERYVRTLALEYKDHIFYITGDKTGKNQHTGLINRYVLIQQALLSVGIDPDKIHFFVKGANDTHEISRLKCNKVLNYYGQNFMISDDCVELRYDIEIAETDESGGLNKKALEEMKPRQGDLLDCFRCLINEAEKEAYYKLVSY